VRVFVVHRSSERTEAQRWFREVNSRDGVTIVPIFLNSSSTENWENVAKNEIKKSELVAVFSPKSCESSENAKLEISIASELGKKIIEVSAAGSNEESQAELVQAYHFQDEFEGCFDGGSYSSQTKFEMYKLMVETSEELVRRRQITNGFFITIVGGLVTGLGFILKEKIVSSEYI